MLKTPEENKTPKIDRVTKFLAVLISLTVAAVGMTAIITQEVTERSTRFGIAAPLFSKNAVLYGVTIVLLGLMPLALLTKTARAALIWSVCCGIAALTSLFAGLIFMK